MRKFVLPVAACMLWASPSVAANDKVLRGPVPAWVKPSDLMPVPADASGLMFVRRQDTLVHLDGQGQAQYVGFRVKILHPNALELGNISAQWNPAAGQPTVHAITIHRDGQAINVLDRASFEILRREDQLEQSMLNGHLTAVLRVDDLRVGDELEVAITTRANDPILGLKDAGLIMLGGDPSPGRFGMGVSWDAGHEPTIKPTADIAKLGKRSADGIVFRFDNPAIQSPPKDAPPRYSWQRVVEYSDFADWPAISRQFSPLFAASATLAPNSPLKAEAQRIAAAHATPLARAAAALKLVQQEVRYIYVGLDGGNLKPASADETWKRRYGDCKGKTVVLLALLKELGIEAEPLLASNAGIDDGLDERLPSPQMFDHVLVRARIAGASYWMDGTLPIGAEPRTVPVMPYRWVLPLRTQGTSIERLPWTMAARPDEISLYEIDARAGFDQPAKVTNTSIPRGIKALQQQAQMSAFTPAQLLAAFRQEMGGSWTSIDDVRWRYDAKADASILTISGKRTIDWDSEGSSKQLSLPGGGFFPPDRKGRSAEQDQAIPFYTSPSYDCSVTTVRLPASTKAAQWSHNSSFVTRLFGKTYYRAFEKRDATIRMVRGVRVERPEIDATSARQDNAKIAAFDNSQAVIYYDPADTDSGIKSGFKVPSTDEIDWTADSVPCLPPAPAK